MLKKIEKTAAQKLDQPQAITPEVVENKSRITFVQKVIKGETYLVMAQSAVELEDEFSNFYYTTKALENLYIQPPFEPKVLQSLVGTNNILGQCVEAMEVNIDGTGHEFIPAHKDMKVDEAEVKQAEEFFEQPYPDETFIKQRRKLRRFTESVGYGYLEILRAADGTMVGVRNIETTGVRFVRLDEPLQVVKKMMRGGKEVEIKIWTRERRFAQIVAMRDFVYYREYGTTRQLHRKTGKWESPENPVPLDYRASEILVFGVHPAIESPYFLPRWINQLPSVVGSRKAEEQNLEFLDAGGMPPAIIFINGGTMMKDTADQLRAYLSGQNKNKHRAVVVETQTSSGSLDSQGKVDTKVERFGAEQANDAMFMEYDKATEEHVRTGFRLPPLFVGKAADYNFATAQTAYMVAEAQVFQPERTEFDAVINSTIMKELGFKTIKFKSKPITLKDVATQLKGLELSKDVASRETFMKEMNTAAGMNLELGELAYPNVASDQEHPGMPTISEIDHKKLPASTPSASPESPQPTPKEPEPKLPPKPEEDTHIVIGEKQKVVPKPIFSKEERKQRKAASELIELAHDYATLQGLVRKRDLGPERELIVREEISNLDRSDKQAFDRLMAQYAFGDDADDLVAVSSLMS
jgi:PBSX family phage portal protein